jgi:hypothetical protein
MVSVPVRTWPRCHQAVAHFFHFRQQAVFVAAWVSIEIDRSPLAMLPAIDAV